MGVRNGSSHVAEMRSGGRWPGEDHQAQGGRVRAVERAKAAVRGGFSEPCRRGERERLHSSDLTTESGCLPSTGPPATSTKLSSAGSAKKDSPSTQLSDMPMESQIEELTARCFLPSLPEMVEMAL